MSPQEEVFRRGLKWSIVAIAIVTVIACTIAYFAGGMPAFWSALAGAGLAAIFGLGTQVGALLAVRKDPLVWVGVTAVSSMAKILLVIVAAVVAQNIEALVRPAFGATLLAGSLAAIIVDIVVFQTGRIPYVQPGPKSPTDEVR
jgi:amino acid transporter